MSEALGEHARHVRVPLEAIALDQREDLFHLPLVVDVFREDVFVERIAGRAVHEQEAVLARTCAAARPGTPSACSCASASIARRFELFARPEDGPLGRRVEALGIEQRPLIVIAQEARSCTP